jgi:hypothetical protein
MPCFTNKAFTLGAIKGCRNCGIEGNKWCSIWKFRYAVHQFTNQGFEMFVVWWAAYSDQVMYSSGCVTVKCAWDIVKLVKM